MEIRIAFREEGKFWNAYLALPNTLQGAKLIGSIMIGAVAQSPEVKQAFMDVMKQVLANAAKDISGETIDEWIEKQAPENEQGHA